MPRNSQNGLSFSQCCRPNGLTESLATGGATSVQYRHLSKRQEMFGRGFTAAVRPTLSVADDEVLGSEPAGLKTPRAFGPPGTTGGKRQRSAESGLCSGHTADVIPESLHHGGGLFSLHPESRSVDVRCQPDGGGPAMGPLDAKLPERLRDRSETDSHTSERSQIGALAPDILSAADSMTGPCAWAKGCVEASMLQPRLGSNPISPPPFPAVLQLEPLVPNLLAQGTD
ncbi:unnamed protein product [Arctogadus glacialis]